ncbi:MAG: SDR family NAD(P)-dependent oxidoreductase [Pirellulales bacterium]
MRAVAGKRALITGAGHGLGRELAIVFAGAGAEVIVTDRDPAGIDETCRRIDRSGGRAHGYPLDITDGAAILQLREQLHRELGPIDLLLNNAGIVRGGLFTEVPVEGHLDTYRVNVLGSVAMTHAFLPDLMAGPEGHLVNIASASALIALPYATTYASSKWAILGFSESIREELRLEGASHVHVTAVCPSYIRTGMCAGARVPLFSRMLTPRRVAETVLKAVTANRELVLMPGLVRLTPLSRGLLPRSWFRAACRWLGITGSMATWHGHVEPSRPTAAAGGEAQAQEASAPPTRQGITLHDDTE